MNQHDPFAEFRINRSEPKSEPKQETQQEDPFSEFRIKKVEGIPYLSEGTRHVTRTASRIAETIGGIPGDISDLIQSGVFAGLENIFGHKIPEEAKKERRKYRAPTSKELKETSEKLTGGYTTPQSEIEKSIDETVETISSLVGPMKFRRALGVGIGSQAAKEGIKLLGLGETPQEATKLGTMFFLSTLNPGAASKYAASQYDKANQLAKGASIYAQKFESNLNNLKTELEKGVNTTAKNSVIRPIDDLLSKVNNGKIKVDELTNAKRDINTIMGDPILLKRERNMLKAVAKEVDQAIKPYEKLNPEFSKVYRPANEIWGAVAEGNKAYNFLKRNASFLGKLLGGAGAAEAVVHPELILPTIATAASTIGAAKGYDFITRVMKSPELRKFYGKALVAAAAEDLPALRLYERKIEEKLQKEESKRPSRPIKSVP